MLGNSSLGSLALELLASVLAPPRCAACDTRVGLRVIFCAQCGRTVEPAPATSADDMAAFAYGAAVARAIVRFKYERRPDLARPLADLLWRAVEPHQHALGNAIVVPVPLHPSRLAERGFNQAALLARRIAVRLDTRVAMRALERIRDTPQQTALDRSARMANVSGAIRMRGTEDVRGRTVLLVDDVRTTGATLETCARALCDAGATSVACAVIARAGVSR